jgi:hypothetical protein
MGFLDNLESSLKSLESQEERDGSEQQRRSEERARKSEAAPWAEKLKNSEYTRKLFDEAALAGHRIRAKVYMSWLDTTLRLEAKGKVLELRPQPEGIIAEYERPDGQSVKQTVDLESLPGDLLRNWLS